MQKIPEDQKSQKRTTGPLTRSEEDPQLTAKRKRSDNQIRRVPAETKKAGAGQEIQP